MKFVLLFAVVFFYGASLHAAQEALDGCVRDAFSVLEITEPVLPRSKELHALLLDKLTKLDGRPKIMEWFCRSSDEKNIPLRMVYSKESLILTWPSIDEEWEHEFVITVDFNHDGSPRRVTSGVGVKGKVGR